VNVCDDVRTPSETVAVTKYAPEFIAVPKMYPVDHITDIPSGRPVAV
jgi:hypothetical protein